MNPPPLSLHHRPLHVLAWLVLVATFPLIFMGGLVTTHGAGMSVPDWPNSYGYNMFTFPPSQWVGGIWYEHVHRLWGSLVGFLSILLCLAAWGPAAGDRARRRLSTGAWVFVGLAVLSALAVYGLRALEVISYDQRKRLDHLVVGVVSGALILGAAALSRRAEPRRWVRWLCTLVLVAVCVQGIKGGLRVSHVNLVLAMVHGCFAQIFFCLAAVTVVVTSRWWATAPDWSSAPTASAGRRIIAAGSVAFAAIFLQLVVGATMRHSDAGLAIPDLPLAFGKVLPPTDDAALAEANRIRARYASDPTIIDSRIRRHLAAPVTLGQVWAHYAHRVGAVVVTGVVLWLAWVAWRRRESLAGLVLAVVGLLAAQFTLGVLTVLWRKPADIASMHVATGALLLMCVAVLTIRACRLYSTRFRAAPVLGYDPLALAPEQATEVAVPVDSGSIHRPVRAPVPVASSTP